MREIGFGRDLENSPVEGWASGKAWAVGWVGRALYTFRTGQEVGWMRGQCGYGGMPV
jgi:hypothetical protein